MLVRWFYRLSRSDAVMVFVIMLACGRIDCQNRSCSLPVVIIPHESQLCRLGAVVQKRV